MDMLDENKWATLRALDYNNAQQTEDHPIRLEIQK